MARAMRVPVERWGVKEVCDWAEYVGLGQYRKRLLHHCIGGALLLELTEQNLKVRCHSHCGRQGRNCCEPCTLRSGLCFLRCMHATLRYLALHSVHLALLCLAPAIDTTLAKMQHFSLP